MPRGDGTGPAGLGPMTGRAGGYCAGYSVPGFSNSIPGRGLFGRGRGFFGGGRGRGFRNMYWATGLPGWARCGVYPAWGWGIAPYSSEQEVEVLKNQAKLMQDEMNAVNERIKELEKLDAESEEKSTK
jgi:hypothetical protein